MHMDVYQSSHLKNFENFFSFQNKVLSNIRQFLGKQKELEFSIRRISITAGDQPDW